MDPIVRTTLLWIGLLVLPALAAYRRRWVVFAIYALGCLIFLFTTLQDRDGWEDLAAVATLLVVVAPIYALASLVWLIGAWRRHLSNRRS